MNAIEEMTHNDNKFNTGVRFLESPKKNFITQYMMCNLDGVLKLHEVPIFTELDIANRINLIFTLTIL